MRLDAQKHIPLERYMAAAGIANKQMLAQFDADAIPELLV
jgi:hypothetical protein